MKDKFREIDLMKNEYYILWGKFISCYNGKRDNWGRGGELKIIFMCVFIYVK